MPQTKPSPFLSQSLVESAQPNSNPSTRSRDSDSNSKHRAAWQELIDYKLIDWGRDPEQLEDEGLDPPSREIIQLAIQVAEKFREAGFPPPDRVVPDANGGIVFERRGKDMTEVVHIWDDGKIEYHRFEGTRLVERRPMA